MLSGRSISLSLFWLLSHLKTDWPKAGLTGGSAGFPVGRGDGRGWTGSHTLSSCSYTFCSWPPACLITRLCPHHTLPSEGSRGMTLTADTKACVVWMWRKTEEWWENDVLTNCVAEEVRRSGTAGIRHEENRKKSSETLMGEVQDLDQMTCIMSSLLSQSTLRPLLEDHIYESTWSSQTFGQNRKHFSPPRMRSNPFSAGQTCDLKAAVGHSWLNFNEQNQAMTERDHLMASGFKDCSSQDFLSKLL